MFEQGCTQKTGCRIWKNRVVYAIVILNIISKKEIGNADSGHHPDFLACGHPVLYRADSGKLYIALKEKSGDAVPCRIFLHVGSLCFGGDPGGSVGGI